MKEKKELNQEDLEKVNGGYYSDYAALSNQLTTSQAYQHVEENLFFWSKSSSSVMYAKLNKCWEDYGWFNLWSYTKYDVEIIESSDANASVWGPGCVQTLHSKEWEVFVNYRGQRPIK